MNEHLQAIAKACNVDLNDECLREVYAESAPGRNDRFAARYEVSTPYGVAVASVAYERVSYLGGSYWRRT